MKLLVSLCFKVVCEMTRAILGPISEDRLYRLHLWGGERPANSGGGGMDEYIGRTAHVSQTLSLSPYVDYCSAVFEHNAFLVS